MTTKLFLIGILFIALLTSCSESTSVFTEGRALSMVNIWLQSYEGNCGGGDNLIFHSGDDVDMTNWRYKNRLEMHADGTASYTIANSLDRYWKGEPIYIIGTWTYEANTETLLILDSKGEILFSFQVYSAYAGLLVLAYNEIEMTSLSK